MHRILFLRLDGFYAGVLEKAQPELTAKPLVIHRDKKVLDANQVAIDRTITRGMALSEAKAILQDGAFFPWEAEPYREAQSAWLGVCNEITDGIEPCEQHSAWLDLSLQLDAEALAFSLCRTLAETMRVIVTPGMAASKWIAKLASDLRVHRCDNAFEASLAMHATAAQPRSFLSSLSTQLLVPVEPEHRKRLEFLGYRTIGEVAKVPLNVLRGQFGDAAAHILRCCRGGFIEPVEAVYPPNSLSERIGFEGSVEDTETLDRGLQHLATSLSERLKKEDKQAKDLTVVLEQEAFATETRRRKFTKPIQNYLSALSSLRLMLNEVPKEPVVAIRARLENVTQAKRIQQELTGRTSAEDRTRGAMAAFTHIRTVFGDASIATGSELVEPRRKQVLRAWRDATGWR